MVDDYTKLVEEARDWAARSASYAPARDRLRVQKLADAVKALVKAHEHDMDRLVGFTEARLDAEAERDALRAQLDAALSCLSATDPGNPFAYDPSEDGSVDESNRDEVVEAAVSVGWNAGAFAVGERIRSAIRLASGTPVEEEQA